MESPHSTIDADDFRVFPRGLDGKARSRHHPEYAGWHRALSWNGRGFERYPEYIVRAQSIHDVAYTVDFARRHDLPISVRGSGHSYAGCFLRNTGILLDLSALREIQIDPVARVATVQPGVTARELSAALAAHGLAFPTGHAGEVGLGGFLLGGGLGINSRAWGGMSTFNLRAIDLVNADGESLHADEQHHAELLWAARGGGPGLFFVVTRFYLDCWPLPASITINTYLAKFSALPELWAQIERAQPDPSLQVMLAVIAHNEESGAEEYGRQVVLNTIAFADSPTQARSLHESLASGIAPGLLQTLSQDEACDFESIYRSSDSMLVCKRYRTDNILTDRIDEAIAILSAHLPAQPSPATLTLMVWRGTPGLPDAAYSACGRVFVSTYAQWDRAENDEANRVWLQSLYDDLSAVARASYINEFDLEARSAQARRCYAAANWTRLRELRARHDPGGVFHDVSMGEG